MKTKSALFLIAFVVALALLVLPGCGGGGGNSGPSVTPVGPPTATLLSVTPASGATNVAENVRPTFEFGTNFSAQSTGSGLVFLCSGRVVMFGQGSSSTEKTSTLTLDPTFGAVVVGDVCTVKGPVVTTDNAGITVTTQVDLTFTITLPRPQCEAPAVRIPGLNVCLYPSAIEVAGTHQLVPATCVFPSQSCFKDTGRYVTMRVTANGQATVVVFYDRVSPISGHFWTAELVTADDLSPIKININNDRLFTSYVEVDWVKATDNGLIWHQKDTGNCETAAPDATNPPNWVSKSSVCS